MVTARLIDNIWATRKADALNGCKLMLAEIIGGTRPGPRDNRILRKTHDGER